MAVIQVQFCGAIGDLHSVIQGFGFHPFTLNNLL